MAMPGGMMPPGAPGGWPGGPPPAAPGGWQVPPPGAGGQPDPLMFALSQKALKSRREHESGKTRRNALGVFLLFAAIGLALGLYNAMANPNNVDCGGNMTRNGGGTCMVLGSNGGDFNYQQMVARNKQSELRWSIAGFAMVAVGIGLAGLTFRAYDPSKPWGTALTAYSCPQCRRPSLQQKKMALRQGRGAGQTRIYALTTACANGCTFATSELVR